MARSAFFKYPHGDADPKEVARILVKNEAIKEANPVAKREAKQTDAERIGELEARVDALINRINGLE